ncbi:MAG: type IV pilus assembly protein PilM [bacterium]
MDEKEKELAATNKLLNIIRGEKKGRGDKQSVQSDTGSDTESFQPVIQKAQKEELKGRHVESSDDHGKDKSVYKNRLTIKPEHGSEKKSFGKTSTNAEIKNRETGHRIQKPHSRPVVLSSESSVRTEKRHLSRKSKGLWQGLLKRREDRAIGLDIGSHSLKYVILQKDMSGIRVLDFKILKLPDGIEEEDRTIFKRNLKSLLAGTDLSNTKIVSSVSGPSVIVRHVQFPPMSQKELIQSLKWEAKSYIPFPADEVNLDYQILPGKNDNHGMDVILVAVTKKLLHSHLEILKDVSIEPDIVDIAPLVLINTFLAAHPDKKHKTVALMYIGAQSSLLSIYRPGSLFFTRDINIAGDAFTKHIQSKWNISYAQAESIKHGENVVDDESLARKKDIQEVLKPVINELIKEVRRSLVYYDNQTGKMGFSNLILTGGGALLAGISQVIGFELGLEVDFLDPFNRLHVDEAGHPELLMKEHAERLSLSLGLALRGII